MKLLALVVYYKGADGEEAKLLKGAYELQSFSFFNRRNVREFAAFTGKVVVERSSVPCRSSVAEKEFFCHVYVRGDRLAGAVISDAEYPSRVAHNLITRCLDEFASKIPPARWPSCDESNVTYNGLEDLLAKYQNPSQADAMTRVQDELDETKVILHNTIEAVLERGEKLDDLVSKSNALSADSKVFYKSARKMNKCCTWI